MVEKKVRELAGGFAAFFDGIFASFPVLKLDGSWPSIGTVDRCLFSLRRSPAKNEADELLLLGAAAYVGLIIHDCWRHFPGVEVELAASGDGPEEVVLRASGGEHLGPGERVIVPLKRTLERILRQPENPFPAFAGEKRLLGPDDNILSVFAAGLACGLSPYGSGAWRSKGLERMQPYLDAAAIESAKSCARYYRRCFPLEDIGAAEELYLPHLTLPPTGYGEPFPAVRAVAHCIQYCRRAGFEQEDMLRLAANLASCPDELMSKTGFAIGIALARGELSETVRALGTQLGPGAALLRPAVMLARTMTGRAENVFEHLQRAEFAAAEEMFESEYAAGLLPLCYLPGSKWLEDPMLRPLAHFLSWSQLDESWQVIDELAQNGITTAPLKLQQAYLEHLRGNNDTALQTLSSVSDSELSASRELAFRASDLRGRIALARRDNQAAAEHFEQAMLTGSTDRALRAETSINLASLYLAQDKAEQSAVVIEQVLADQPLHPTARLQQMLAAAALGRFEELPDLVNQSTKLMGISPRLFTLVKDYLIGSKHGQAGQ